MNKPSIDIVNQRKEYLYKFSRVRSLIQLSIANKKESKNEKYMPAYFRGKADAYCNSAWLLAREVKESLDLA